MVYSLMQKSEQNLVNKMSFTVQVLPEFSEAFKASKNVSSKIK